MNFYDELIAFLDQENSITVRWISNALRMRINDVTKVLQSRKNSLKDAVKFSYLISGIDKLNNFIFVVTDEIELENVRKRFLIIKSEEIYAIHKLLSSSYKNDIFQSECAQASDILAMNHPNSDYFLNNSVGFIKCIDNMIDIKPVGQRILSTLAVVKNDKLHNLSSMQASVSKILTSKTEEKSHSMKSVSVLKSKSSIQPMNFFSASTSNSKKQIVDIKASYETKKTEVLIEEPKTLESLASIQISTIHKVEEEVVLDVHPYTIEEIENDNQYTSTKKIINGDDDDDEWESECKPDPNKLKERILKAKQLQQSQIKTIPDLDIEVEEVSGVNEKSSTKTKNKVHIHGAMDDYMEDVKISEFHQSKENGDVHLKKTKRKLVEKMFADEKGYLVTEMVWEDITDDELDNVAIANNNYLPSSKRSKTLSEVEKLNQDSSVDTDINSKENLNNNNNNNNKETCVNDKEKKNNIKDSSKLKKIVPSVQQKGMLSFFSKKNKKKK